VTGPRRPEGTNGWAIAAFVLGILGGTILSVIFAIVALFQTMDRRQRGRGLAIAALVISAAWIAVVTSLIAYGLSVQGKSVHAIDLKTGDCVKDGSESELPTWVKRVRGDRPRRSALRSRTRGPTVGQTANRPSSASQCRNMSGGHRCETDATVSG
jgi:hypothetical protein